MRRFYSVLVFEAACLVVLHPVDRAPELVLDYPSSVGVYCSLYWREAGCPQVEARVDKLRAFVLRSGETCFDIVT